MKLVDLFRRKINLQENTHPHAKRMIEGINSLAETNAKEVMLPRVDVVFMEYEQKLPELLQKARESGHSRFPVYKDNVDNILGVLYIKDLLNVIGNDKQKIDWEKVLRPPYFVPESKKLDSLLREMQKRRVHIAISVDEYGGTSGIICLEDIIEEIVGEIQDEFDHEVDGIVKLGEQSYLCDARVNIEELNERLSLQLPNDAVDTLGGFVFELFDKIPVRFEKVNYEQTDFIVQEMDGRSIKKIKLVRNKL